MNKIICGKRYDTEKAVSIFQEDTSVGRSIEMFRKKTGEFFVVYWTQWQGEKHTIEPLSFNKAKKLCEKYLSADECEQLFGDAKLTGERKTMSFMLDTGAIDKIKRIAAESGRQISDVIIDMIMQA